MTVIKHGKSEGFDSCCLVILLKIGFESSIFGPCNIEFWWMTSKNNRAPPLYYVKLCASFQAIGELKLELQSGNSQFGSILVIFLSCVTLKFEGWSWKSRGHLFYATSSFVHHFIAICEFKLEFQSWKAQFGSKSAIFCPRDLAIWRMTLKNNRAPFLYHNKLCASFQSHQWIQTGVTVRKPPI